jgi:predicted exporter
MMRNFAILLALALVVFGAIVLLSSSNVSIVVNGHELKGPMETVTGVWGLMLGGIVLFCVAILLVFVLAGVGLIILGVFILVGLILAAVLFPFMLPLLIPLFVVWVFCGIFCKRKKV